MIPAIKSIKRNNVMLTIPVPCISGTRLFKIEAIKVLLAFYDYTRKAQRFGYDST